MFFVCFVLWHNMWLTRSPLVPKHAAEGDLRLLLSHVNKCLPILVYNFGRNSEFCFRLPESTCTFYRPHTTNHFFLCNLFTVPYNFLFYRTILLFKIKKSWVELSLLSVKSWVTNKLNCTPWHHLWGQITAGFMMSLVPISFIRYG